MTAAFNTIFVGKVLQHFEVVDSTNDLAARLIAANPRPIDGTAILADFQTAGRGQMGAVWESLAGKNLLVSFVFFPKFLPANDQWQLSEAVALAVFKVVEDFFPNRTAIKWPNDILVEGRKIAGILIQNSISGASISSSIIGIGLNLNQSFFESPTARATSFLIEKGQTVDGQLIFDKLCKSLEINYLILKNNNRDLHDDYLKRLFLFEKKARFARPDGQIFEAKIADIDRKTGRLVLQTESGCELFEVKQIRLLY